MEPSSLPQWAEVLFYIIIAAGTAITGVYSYVRKKLKEDETTTITGSPSVISASLIESKLLKDLIETIREFQDEQSRDIKKTHRLVQDLKEALNELNESTIVQTDTTMNLVRFINRETNKNKLVNLKEHE